MIWMIASYIRTVFSVTQKICYNCRFSHKSVHGLCRRNVVLFVFLVNQRKNQRKVYADSGKAPIGNPELYSHT